MIDYSNAIKNAKLGFSDPAKPLAKTVYTSFHFGVRTPLLGDLDADYNITPHDCVHLATAMHNEFYGDIKSLWDDLWPSIAMSDAIRLNPRISQLCEQMTNKLKYPQNLTAVLTAAKTESAEKMVPEAGIEPATKGL